MTGLKGYDVICPWIHRGVHILDFFQHYKGVYKHCSFDSLVPPPMYFQNKYDRLGEFQDFVGKRIMTHLEEGMDPPLRVVNALSVEPTKPRLINSMKGVNLFCKKFDFSLMALSEIVHHIPQGSFFLGA